MSVQESTSPAREFVQKTVMDGSSAAAALRTSGAIASEPSTVAVGMELFGSSASALRSKLDASMRQTPRPWVPMKMRVEPSGS